MDSWEAGFNMKKRKGRDGFVAVEAAILFPLILLFAISGFSLMVRWYSSWEREMNLHRQRIQEEKTWGNDQLVKWRQWKTLWEKGENDEGT